MAADYSFSVTLPTKGLIYKTIPAELVLRPMKTSEEKILFASVGGDVFKRILKNCIVEPEGIDLGELIPADEEFLILQLRINSYGADYHVQGKCPECGHKEVFDVDLTDFSVYSMEDDFVEPISVTLPRSGHELALRLLRTSDQDFVSKRAKKLAKATGANEDELVYDMRMARSIVSVDGQTIDFETARNFVNDLIGQDSAFFSESLEMKLGYDTTITRKCGRCGEEYDFRMPINGEFFRPRTKR